MEDFDGLTPPSNVAFEKAEFLVRMYNLPMGVAIVIQRDLVGYSE